MGETRQVMCYQNTMLGQAENRKFLFQKGGIRKKGGVMGPKQVKI